MEEQDDFADIERLERFLDGKEPGVRLIDVLSARGIQVPPEESLDDPALSSRLWDIIDALAHLQVALEFTDHLTDRQLYRTLVNETLVQEIHLPTHPATWCHILFSGEDDSPALADRDRRSRRAGRGARGSPALG